MASDQPKATESYEKGNDQTAESGNSLDRRTVLSGMTTAAVAGIGGVSLTGAASAHEGEEVVFCGCSQVCACGDGLADVLVAWENGDGWSFEWIRGNEFNFCLSIDDPGVPDGKIIAVQVAGTRWINPNQCAQKALVAEQEQLPSEHPRPEGDAGGPCGHPPCEHPSRNRRGRNGNGNNGNGNGTRGNRNSSNGNGNRGNRNSGNGNGRGRGRN